MKRSTKIGLIVLAGLVIVFAVLAYFSLFNKLAVTKEELRESRTLVFQAIRDKQRLRDELKTTKDQLEEVREELESTRKELSLVNLKLLTTEKDNRVLLQEKDKLEARLHSLEELKKAIRQVRLEAREKKVRQDLIRKKLQEEVDTRELKAGNRGFLIKDGCSLSQSKTVLIEVRPAD